MFQQTSADIIPFPTAPRDQAPAANPTPPQAVAAKAGPLTVGTLAAALADQHAALLEWRAALEDLRDSLNRLGGNLRHLEAAVSAESPSNAPEASADLMGR